MSDLVVRDVPVGYLSARSDGVVAAGAALAFLTTMRELPATLMLHPTDFETIVTYVWLVRGAGYYGRAAVPTPVLVGISGLLMLVILARERYDV